MTDAPPQPDRCRRAGCSRPRTRLSVFCDEHHREQLERATDRPLVISADYFNEFSTVRALCTGCGWFRVLGYCGRKDQVRALLRIDGDPAGCNLLRGRVLEFPGTSRPDDWPDGYRDLREESYRSGMLAVERTLDPLLGGRCCPRCKRAGKLRVDWYTMIGGDPRVAKMRA